MAKISGLWRDRVERIKPYVGFRVNQRKGLTEYQKAKIRKYYKAIEVLSSPARPSIQYRGKPGSKRLRGAQRYAQHPPGVTQLKVAFIPHPYPDKVHLRFDKKGRLTDVIDNRGVHRRVYLFADFERYKGEVSNNPRIVCERIKKADKGKSLEFRVLNGEWEIGGANLELAFVPEYLERLVAQYGSTDPDDQDDAPTGSYTREKGKADKYDGHHAVKWLKGLAGYSYFNQSDMVEYDKARGISKKKAKARHKRKYKTKEDV